MKTCFLTITHTHNRRGIGIAAALKCVCIASQVASRTRRAVRFGVHACGGRADELHLHRPREQGVQHSHVRLEVLTFFFFFFSFVSTLSITSTFFNLPSPLCWMADGDASFILHIYYYTRLGRKSHCNAILSQNVRNRSWGVYRNVCFLQQNYCCCIN